MRWTRKEAAREMPVIKDALTSCNHKSLPETYTAEEKARFLEIVLKD